MVIDFGSFNNLPYEFDKIFQDVFNPHHYRRKKASYPPLNIVEDEKNIYIRAEVPGLTIDDMEITITAKNLVIKGERKLPEGRYFRQERPSGVFQRLISINTIVDEDNVSATIKDGILNVVLPKSESSIPKKVEIAIE
ncbi:Hsp20/alpha crystallin family protein [Maridesulfovibrio hydrothermalis]|uniref:Heat shock protein Hsp20 n=1 Tax=Maridesulfovibrio hydrothermalis AM13 = DSM 14728 TaxID=1121451 RepID=L0R880_9BACT|nr:Hsp20/alpha crystallin family protein [Maridesulfovibrio hydrothermalis]CCO22949.1 Heat shock protein Hsp20 [Maridesulfovibrio hydrothermalis AM13 = DSM 14728]